MPFKETIKQRMKKDYPFAKKNKSEDFPPPGECISVLTKAFYPDRYADRSGVEFEYQLKSIDNNKIYRFKETFVIIGNYDRFEKFYDYIDALDFEVEDFTDLVGLREKVQLKYEYKATGMFTNIVKREYISYEPQNIQV